MSMMNKLLSTNQRIFHLEDLRLLLGVRKPETLRKRVYRYIKNGDLFSIQRGLYSIVLPEKLSPEEVGVFLCHDYCYLSLQTILDRTGVINGRSQYFTFISNRPRRLSWNNFNYIYRQLKPEFLHNDFGVNLTGGVYTATTERAVADMIYFNPVFHFDNLNVVNMDVVKKIQREVGYL